MNAFVIYEYWYDPLENRNDEGYSPIGIVLSKEEAESFVNAGGKVPGRPEVVFPVKPNGVPDFTKNGTLTKTMNKRYRYEEFPVLGNGVGT